MAKYVLYVEYYGNTANFEDDKLFVAKFLRAYEFFDYAGYSNTLFSTHKDGVDGIIGLIGRIPESIKSKVKSIKVMRVTEISENILK